MSGHGFMPAIKQIAYIQGQRACLGLLKVWPRLGNWPKCRRKSAYMVSSINLGPEKETCYDGKNNYR